jgi:hypothetical protein
MAEPRAQLTYQMTTREKRKGNERRGAFDGQASPRLRVGEAQGLLEVKEGHLDGPARGESLDEVLGGDGGVGAEEDTEGNRVHFLVGAATAS